MYVEPKGWRTAQIYQVDADKLVCSCRKRILPVLVSITIEHHIFWKFGQLVLCVVFACDNHILSRRLWWSLRINDECTVQAHPDMLGYWHHVAVVHERACRLCDKVIGVRFVRQNFLEYPIIQLVVVPMEVDGVSHRSLVNEVDNHAVTFSCSQRRSRDRPVIRPCLNTCIRCYFKSGFLRNQRVFNCLWLIIS